MHADLIFAYRHASSLVYSSSVFCSDRRATIAHLEQGLTMAQQKNSAWLFWEALTENHYVAKGSMINESLKSTNAIR